MRRNGSTAWLTVCALALLVLPAAAQGRGPPGGAMPCMKGMPPDSATRAQMGAIHTILMNHDKITRSVTNMPNGVRTVTESSDPALAQVIKAHVATMDWRALKGDDPGMPMESPALREIIKNKKLIRTTMDMTERGVVLVQTSTDRKVATALQQHAAEISTLVAGGMTAMHQAMMKNPPCAMPMGKPPQ
jgi:hypothetical protein